MYHSKGEARNRKLLVRKQQFLGGNPLICSFDLAKKTHAFRVSDRARQPVASGTLSHTREGVERLLEKLEGLRTAQGYDRIVFFMEGASHFWMPLASLFERRGYPYRLVLNQATRHQRHLDGRARNYSDPIDAGHIGDLGRELHFTFSQLPKDPEWIGLRARAAEFQDLQDLATAEKNRIHAFLETAFMGYYAIFIDPFRPSSRAVLRALLGGLLLVVPVYGRASLVMAVRSLGWSVGRVSALCGGRSTLYAHESPAEVARPAADVEDALAGPELQAPDGRPLPREMKPQTEQGVGPVVASGDAVELLLDEPFLLIRGDGPIAETDFFLRSRHSRGCPPIFPTIADGPGEIKEGGRPLLSRTDADRIAPGP